MPSCAARNCTNRSVRLHRFPLKQNDRLQLWLQNIGRPNWTPKAGSRLCSIHFEKECFYTATDGRVLLTDTAVPSIISLPKSLQQQKMKGKSKLPVTMIDQACKPDAYLADHAYFKAVRDPVGLHDSRSAAPAPPEGGAAGAPSEDHGSEMQGGGDRCENDNAWIEVEIKEEDMEVEVSPAEEEGLEQHISECVGHDHGHLYSGRTYVSVDHTYMLADSPKALKRKLDAVHNKLQQCRKRVKLQNETIKRLRRKITSLKMSS